MDRWAGTDGEYDRWAGTDGRYDRRARADGEYDRWAEADGQYDRWAEADGQYDRWAEADGRFDRPGRPASRFSRPAVKWVGLLIAWVIVTALLSVAHLGVLIWVVMVGLIGYVVYSILRDTPRGASSGRRFATAGPAFDGQVDDGRAYTGPDYEGPEQFNAPPGWPEPPPGWTPPPGWQPNPAWPPAPRGWQFWLPPSRLAFGARTARTLHHPRGGSHRSRRGEANGDSYTDRWR